MTLLLRHRHGCLHFFRQRNLSSLSSNAKPYYITTPIFYPNANPHIGHLYSLVAADVFARYQRLVGRKVQFLAGTDEHGMKIQKAALLWAEGKEGKEREFCDSLSSRFRELGKQANISNTTFMRTTNEEHYKAVDHVWRDLASKGLIYKNRYSGWYSITDECFYTDAQIASSPTSPSQKISTETGAVVEWSSEENYIFRLSFFKEALRDHYTSHPHTVYPPQYHADVLQMLGELGDISISRPRTRLSWGVPVPEDDQQTVYVWFDALLVYLSGIGYPWSGQVSPSSGWPADLQVIGKDILRFHGLYLPAMLMGLSDGVSYSESSTLSLRPNYPLPFRLLTHAHWTSGQKKMSKSLGNVADPLEAMKKLGIDVVRFYLMRIGGRWKDDVDWSEEQLEKHAKEIQAQLGNYFLRVASPKIAARARSSTTTSFEEYISPLNKELDQAASQLPAKVREEMDKLEVAQALEEIMSVLKLANKIFTSLAPWSAAAATPELVKETRRVGLGTLVQVGKCLQPFMPEVAERMLDALRVPSEERGLLVMDSSQTDIDEDSVHPVKLFES